MAGTVIHVPPETHAEFKAECSRRGRRMRNVIDELIRTWIATPDLATPDIVTKKPAPTVPSPPVLDPYTLPPFWSGRTPPINRS